MPKLTAEQCRMEDGDAREAVLARIAELEANVVELRAMLRDIVESSKCVGGVEPKEWRAAEALMAKTDAAR